MIFRRYYSTVTYKKSMNISKLYDIIFLVRYKIIVDKIHKLTARFNMQQQQTYNLTEGNVSKLILRFFFPIFFTNMLQQIYNVADTVIVGKGLGDNALAAVGNMSSLTYFVIGFSNGLAGGFSIVFAQHYGANKYHDLRRSIASAIKLCLVITIVLTTGSIVALKPVLQLMHRYIAEPQKPYLSNNVCRSFLWNRQAAK